MKLHKGLTPLSSYFEQVKEKLKVEYPDTLFPPIWGAILTDHCPLCGCRLYEMRRMPLWYCKSNKHKRFTIKSETVARLKAEMK